MTKSYILSGKKLPEQLVEILNALGKIFASRRIEFFIIGATARDILMEHLHKAGIRKATLDIDLAVYVPNWNAYDSLIEEILSTENFSQGNIPHRIVYKENYEVDIIPFGDLERDGAIHWPPDETKAMTVLGFVETYHNAIDLTIEETNESFKVVSIPGLMIHKIIAWAERAKPDKKISDAKDIAFIIENYFEINMEIIFADHEDLTVADDFDRHRIAARVLGRDIGVLLAQAPKAAQRVISILEKQAVDDETSHLARDLDVRDVETGFGLLESLLAGIKDRY